MQLTNEHTVKKRPRVLVVDDEPAMVELARDLCAAKVDCTVVSAADLRQARKLLSQHTFELLVADVHLPDGDGTELLSDLRAGNPQARAIMMSGQPSVGSAVAAIREGAADYVVKPFTAEQFVDRVHVALRQQAAGARNHQRLTRLKVAVRKLNQSRRMVSRKVDLLCNDLVSAYGELSRQVDGVRNQESFRKLMSDADDLEQMLCHGMDWLLRHAGYCNVAIWLASDDRQFELGAYMKYTIAGEKALTDAMTSGLLPLTIREGFLHLDVEHVADVLTPPEVPYLAGQTVMGTSCTYLGEALAGVILFRDGQCPFTDDDAAMLKAIAPVFAIALASMVRRGEAGDDGPDDAPDDDHPRDGRGRGVDADWWKRGEAPPF
jgi:FixJ family two-component response regulator